MFNYTELKDNVKFVLDGNLPHVKEVAIDKILPNETTDLPSVSIYTLATSASGLSTSTDPDNPINPMFNTEIAIVLDIIVSQNETFMAVLDEIVEAIKVRMFSETLTEWYTPSELTQVIGYDYNITASPEGAKETVTGELIITVLTCENF